MSDSLQTPIKDKANERGDSNASSPKTITSRKTTRTRKRKRLEINKDEIEAEIGECDLSDAIAIEKKLRKIAIKNDLNDDEMKKLLQKFVKNEYILALVMLKAEDEIAKDRKKAKQKAIIITDTPSIPKLTRAKAREMHWKPAITLPPLFELDKNEIVSLIKNDSQSQEEEEEEEEEANHIISDDEQNISTSEIESNPCTPQTPAMNDNSNDAMPRLTADGCFVIPNDRRLKVEQEQSLIATRTRSKLCLQETSIEDVGREHLSPNTRDDMVSELDLIANDEEWMRFLNDFSKPLNNMILTDDDDPVNDPEYVAAEKVPVDAEELRDVNISRKELAELLGGLYDELENEGVYLDGIDLVDPQRAENEIERKPNEESCKPSTISQCIDRMPHENRCQTDDDGGENQQEDIKLKIVPDINSVSDATISSSSIFPNALNSTDPDVISNTITTDISCSSVSFAIGQQTNANTIVIPNEMANGKWEWVAVPVAGQPNCFQLTKIVTAEELALMNAVETETKSKPSIPYDINYGWKYISLKKQVYSEYLGKCEEQLKNTNVINTVELPTDPIGFTESQYYLLQQQLCIHVQLLTVHFLQSYAHPDLWRFSQTPLQMLQDLEKHASVDPCFRAWNLYYALELIAKWKEDLSENNRSNTNMMEFLHKEIDATSVNSRQVGRFAPKLMDTILGSVVFMYPEYLPRIPFTGKMSAYHNFSPSEQHLLAIGLERYEKSVHKLGNLSMRRASEYIYNNIIRAKTPRRICDYMRKLQNVSYYNPVKYYYEKGHAPPVKCKVITFDSNIVLPPEQRPDELPPAWRKYLHERQAGTNKIKGQKKTARVPLVSEAARKSYLENVREAVSDELLSNEYSEFGILHSTPINQRIRKKRHKLYAEHNKENSAEDVVNVHTNYIIEHNVSGNVLSANNSVVIPTAAGYSLADTTATEIVTNSCSSQNIVEANSLSTSNQAIQSDKVIGYNYNIDTGSLELIVDAANTQAEDSAQSKITDYFYSNTRSESNLWQDLENAEQLIDKKSKSKRRQHRRNQRKLFKTTSLLRSFTGQYLFKRKRRRSFRKRYNRLLTHYWLCLIGQDERYSRQPLLQYFYRHFKALELYTKFLKNLKMSCKNYKPATNGTATDNNANAGKRSRCANIDEEISGCSKNKKSHRPENFKNMLLPDSADDINRKDSIYAFNFYDKVEEMLKSADRLEDCKRFNQILKSFDPHRHKVGDLYNKLESIFLPDFPELAEVFLTFLLPPEAAEIGKFFEHFMATNMTTFINKLNIYFNHQPAQIRRIYNCLSELADDENVSLKKIETKILPLLKGNQFLVDWFMQLFPAAPPPERLLTNPEYINLKHAQHSQNGEYLETIVDLLDQRTSTMRSPCQLRYINGRIFYGSKILLPAKLSFMAQSYCETDDIPPSENNDTQPTFEGCMHPIRSQGERNLENATTTATITVGDSSGDNDKPCYSEEDSSHVLLASCVDHDAIPSSSSQICDDAALNAHAKRLNPNFYSSTSFKDTIGASTNVIQHGGKKSTTDEVKLSPRKQQSNVTQASKALSGQCPVTVHSPGSTRERESREKRKSPTKRSTANGCSNANGRKSPIFGVRNRLTQRAPIIVTPHSNSAINCAKKLKSLIDGGGNMELPQADSKDSNAMIVKARSRPISSGNDRGEISLKCNVKAKSIDDLESSSEFEAAAMKPRESKVKQSAATTCNDNDPIVTSTDSNNDENDNSDVVTTTTGADDESSPSPSTLQEVNSCPLRWTREEDKIILIEMKLDSRNHEALVQRISAKLPERSIEEITGRHKFLVDFLTKLQVKQP